MLPDTLIERHTDANEDTVVAVKVAALVTRGYQRQRLRYLGTHWLNLRAEQLIATLPELWERHRPRNTKSYCTR